MNGTRFQALIVLAAVALAPIVRSAQGCDAEPKRKSPSSRAARPMPHMDHSPKHGGVFFMASNREHHLEGVYLRPGVIRIYLYDKYTQPIQGAFFKGTAELRGPAAAKPVPLTLDDDGTMVAPFPLTSFPFQVNVHLTCPVVPGSKALDDVFTFQFDRFTDEARPVTVAKAQQ